MPFKQRHELFGVIHPGGSDGAERTSAKNIPTDRRQQEGQSGCRRMRGRKAEDEVRGRTQEVFGKSTGFYAREIGQQWRV